jgi:hypothetical protein
VKLKGAKVLILSSTDPTLANYQLWRIALLTIDTLQKQATSSIPKAKTGAVPPSVVGVDTAISSTLAIVQTIAGFFATNESVTGIQGTSQDQALVDAVSRQLRAMGANVFVPSLYSPLSLGGLDYAKSPFLANLQDLLRTRSKLATALSDKTLWDKNTKQIADDTSQIAKLKAEDEENQKKGKAPANTAEITRLSKEVDAFKAVDATLSQKYDSIADISNIQLSTMIQNIDSFFAALIASNVSAVSTATPPASNTSPASTSPSPTGNGGTQGQSPQGQNPTTGTGNTNVTNNIGTSTPTVPAPPPIPPVVSILYADGLARTFGATPADTNPDTSNWRVLSLKALETGPTVVARARFFGTKILYGGGAVATYMLFDLKGNVYCSANVFDYGGRIEGKDFNGQFRSPDVNPGLQLLFSRGRCSTQIQ